LSFPEVRFSFEKIFKLVLKKTESLGEVVICPREVKKYSRRLNIPFEEEFSRVLIHGVLHLLGYSDEESEKIAEKMRKREKYYFEKFKKFDKFKEKI